MGWKGSFTQRCTGFILHSPEPYINFRNMGRVPLRAYSSRITDLDLIGALPILLITQNNPLQGRNRQTFLLMPEPNSYHLKTQHLSSTYTILMNPLGGTARKPGSDETPFYLFLIVSYNLSLQPGIRGRVARIKPPTFVPHNPFTQELYLPYTCNNLINLCSY